MTLVLRFVMHFHNFVWSKNTIQETLTGAGLTDVTLSDAVVSKDGIDTHGEEFWAQYKTCPDQLVIEARKA